MTKPVFPKRVTLPAEYFRNNTDLTELDIPEGFTRIWEQCCEGCTALRRVSLPSTMTSVRARAFAECTALTHVDIHGQDTRIDATAFTGCTALDDESIEALAAHASTRPGKMTVGMRAHGAGRYLDAQHPRAFLLDGVPCASIISAIRAMVFADDAEQRRVCALDASAARAAGNEWRPGMPLHWQGATFSRTSGEYQQCLNRLLEAVFQQDRDFRRLLMVRRGWLYNARMAATPDMGLLTEAEYCERLAILGQKGQLDAYETLPPAPKQAAPARQPDEQVQRVVVLGGSFCPVTVAHQQLLIAAMDAIGADKGVFLPASQPYVTRKFAKAKESAQLMPEATRTALLSLACKADSRLVLDPYELSCPKGMTYESLEAIQGIYPNAVIHFLIGSDKLHIIPRWHRAKELLARFRILVASRSDEDVEALLAGNSFLAANRTAFALIDLPVEMGDVSSSQVRQLLQNGDEAAKALMPAGAWDVLYPPDTPITSFREEHFFLSNFYPCAITLDGLTYQNGESAFQTQKCLTDAEKAAFFDLPAKSAKAQGRRVQLRPDWNEVRVDVMQAVLRAKFTQNAELRAQLLGTRERLLVEGNNWNDTFWGVSNRTGKGQNQLGKLLMKLREELREEG